MNDNLCFKQNRLTILFQQLEKIIHKYLGKLWDSLLHIQNLGIGIQKIITTVK